MNNIKHLKRDSKLTILSFIVPVLLQVALFGFQAYNGIISIWNIVASVIVVGIFVNAIKSNKRNIKNAQIDDDDFEVTGGSTVAYTKAKTSKKTRIIFFILSVLLAASSVICFHFYNVKSKGLDAVDATVIWQKGEINIDVKEEDGEEVHSETRELEVIVLYEFDGKFQTATLKSSTISELKVTKVKVYVDSTGKAVCDCGRIDVLKYEGIVLMCFAIMMFVVALLGLGIEFSAGGIMMFLGIALMLLIGSQFIENILYNDLVCFTSAFVLMGLTIIVYGILSKIFNKNTALNVSDYQNTFIEEKPIDVVNNNRVCSYCGNLLKDNEDKCEGCGASSSVIKRDL